MRDMNLAHNLQSFYQEKMGHRDHDGNLNWSEWAQENPDREEVLIAAAKAYTLWKADKDYL